MKAIYSSLRRSAILGILPLLVLGGSVVCGAGVEPVRSYVVMEHYSGRILTQKAGDEKLPIANLTNVATACVVIDWAEATKAELNESIVVPPSAGTLPGANALGMVPGDTLTIRDALYACLMSSDNVSAEALANHVGLDMLRRRGRQGHPIQEFVNEMNALASTLNMTKTRFANPHGLDAGIPKKQAPYSTAIDMALLVKYAMDKASFRFYVSQKSRDVRFRRAGQPKSFLVKNTNTLVGTQRIDGVKTGMTPASGPCLAVSATRPNRVQKLADGGAQVQKQRMIVVILGAQDRFGAAKELLNWGWQQAATPPATPNF